MSLVFCSDVVLRAYQDGYFPMADNSYGDIYWHSPDPRAIFPLHNIFPSKKLEKTLMKNNFAFSINSHFETVIRRCADREDTWISEAIIDVYTQLHYEGYAHSVEVYQANNLVGGLYGVAIKGAFFGESMFNTEPNSSKAAFYYLVHHLKSRGYILLDSQYINPFTKQLGAIEISRVKYLYILKRALEMNVSFI